MFLKKLLKSLMFCAVCGNCLHVEATDESKAETKKCCKNCECGDECAAPAETVVTESTATETQEITAENHSK